MKLFCVIGELKTKYSVVRHYTVESEREATDCFLKEYKNMDFFNISVSQIEEIDGVRIILKKEDDLSIPIFESVSNVKCYNCGFTIAVYGSQERVVCGHCHTMNDLTYNFGYFAK